MEREGRWLVLAASFVVAFSTWSAQAGFGVFLPILSQEFGWSRGTISVAFTLNLLIGGLLGFGIGAAIDRYGPRSFMALSTLVVVASFLLASAMNALWHLYLLLGLLNGVGMAGMYLVPTATVSRWFVRQRGLAVGIVLSSFGLAYTTGAPLTAFLLRFFDWRMTYLLLGGFVCVVALPATWLIKDPPTGSDPQPALAEGAARGSRERHAPALAQTLRQVAGGRSFWMLLVIWFLQGFALMMLSVHIVPYATDQGLTLEHASLALTIYGVSSIVGRLIFGVTADTLGTKFTFLLCVGLELASTAWLMARPSVWTLYLLMVLFGCGSAGSDTAVVKAATEILGTRSIGAVMGLLSFGWRCGAAAGPAVAGYLHDATGLYTIAFGLASLGMLACGWLFAGVRSLAR